MIYQEAINKYVNMIPTSYEALIPIGITLGEQEYFYPKWLIDAFLVVPETTEFQDRYTIAFPQRGNTFDNLYPKLFTQFIYTAMGLSIPNLRELDLDVLFDCLEFIDMYCKPEYPMKGHILDCIKVLIKRADHKQHVNVERFKLLNDYHDLGIPYYNDEDPRNCSSVVIFAHKGFIPYHITTYRCHYLEKLKKLLDLSISYSSYLGYDKPKRDTVTLNDTGYKYNIVLEDNESKRILEINEKNRISLYHLIKKGYDEEKLILNETALDLINADVKLRNK